MYPLLSPRKIRQFFAILRDINPLPTTELVYHSHFQLLVAVMLSAQTTDKAVNACTPALFARAPDAPSMASLGSQAIAKYIQSIGLYNNKAKNLAKTSEILVEQHQGEVPQNRKALEALPGVGRKTANVVLNEGFGYPTMAVDTHVFRVANRTGLVRGKNVAEVEQQLLQRIPKDFLPSAHHWLILLGRYTCKARLPQCSSCPVRNVCYFPHKT